MSDRSAAIGLASASSGLPPPNSSACGLEMNDQVTASTMPRAASARLALRVRTWIGVSTGLRGASPRVERRRRHAVDADDAHDLLDDVGLALDVRPPRRHRDLHALALRRRRRSRAARARAASRSAATSRPASRFTFAEREIDDRSRALRPCRRRRSRDGVPPQRSSTICVASSRPGTMKSGSTPRSKR